VRELGVLGAPSFPRLPLDALQTIDDNEDLKQISMRPNECEMQEVNEEGDEDVAAPASVHIDVVVVYDLGIPLNNLVLCVNII
jgi:hypothetical protein